MEKRFEIQENEGMLKGMCIIVDKEIGLQEIKADSFWILDPVDGTTNLNHNYFITDCFRNWK